MYDGPYFLKVTDANGDVVKTTITREQAATLRAGRAITFFPRDEGILVDDDGTITRAESAVPEGPEGDDDGR